MQAKNVFMRIALYMGFLLSIAACQKAPSTADHLGLSDQLAGKWTATAWTGELHEVWATGKDGWLIQEGHYIEDGDTTYSANTKIEQVGDEIILFSVIKNSNPKIFKGSSISPTGFVVENDDYQNPVRVEYKFLSPDNYQRTITGFEQDSLVSTTFNFTKQ